MQTAGRSKKPTEPAAAGWPLKKMAKLLKQAKVKKF
jgi:hypothetical protein